MKTLLELLSADRAVSGDVYRAGHTNWSVSYSGALESGEAYLCEDTLRVLSAEGWVRVTPAIPLPPARVEFETEVEHRGVDYGTIVHPALQQFWGKHVKVTVEEIV